MGVHFSRDRPDVFAWVYLKTSGQLRQVFVVLLRHKYYSYLVLYAVKMACILCGNTVQKEKVFNERVVSYSGIYKTTKLSHECTTPHYINLGNFNIISNCTVKRLLIVSCYAQ